MHVLVFATGNPDGGASRWPFCAIPDSATAVLPQHPQGGEWAYFATMAADDVMLLRASDRLLSELGERGHFIWRFPRLKTVASGSVAVSA